MKKNEVVLPNTTLEYVRLYIHDKLEEMEKASFQDVFVQYHSFWVYENSFGKTIDLDCSYSITYSPERVVTTHAHRVMSFKAFQVQINTVKVKAECHARYFDFIFNNYWNGIIKDFNVVQPNERNMLIPVDKNVSKDSARKLRVPQRNSIRFKEWVDRWNIVKPMCMSGLESYESMLRYVELSNHDLVCSKEILKENILAGKNGLLEPLKTP